MALRLLLCHVLGALEDISKKVTWLTVQVKCLCTGTLNVGNKQEELEATVLLDSQSLRAMSEILRG